MSTHDPVADLYDDAYRLSRLYAPAHLTTHAPTYDSLDGFARPGGYVITSRRGERNVANVTRQTDAAVDNAFHKMLTFIREAGSREIAGRHPQLAPVLQGCRLLDRHTPVPRLDMAAQKAGVYKMSDLRFNLTPRRSIFLKQFKDSIESSSIYADLINLLDESCAEGAGCMYSAPQFFDYVGCPGPVMLNDTVQHILTAYMHAATDSATINRLAGVIHTTLIESDSAKTAPASKVSQIKKKVCVVCFVVAVAKQQWFLNGSVKGKTGDGSDTYSLFLVDTTPADGFEWITKADYFADAVNVNESQTIQIGDRLSIFNRYRVKKNADGEWVGEYKEQ